MKQTKITQDKTQTRSTIPKEFVDKHEVTSEDSMEWDDKGGKLKGVLKKNEWNWETYFRIIRLDNV